MVIKPSFLKNYVGRLAHLLSWPEASHQIRKLIDMQGQSAVLNIMTLPPGATQTQARLVLDGIRGAIFEYQTGGPVGALVSSWARTAGTDPYGNAYPAGFNAGSGSSFTGTDFDINASGAFQGPGKVVHAV
jgi:hypothetical protein